MMYYIFKGSDKMTFGERLMKARDDKGYKQNQFAEMLEITPTRLNYWEKDKREPDVAMIKKISSLLGVSSDWLIGNDTYSNSENFILKDSEKSIIKKYRFLDTYGQELIDKALDIEYRRCESQRESDNCSEMVTIVEAARTIDNRASIRKRQVPRAELEIFDIASQSDEEL